MAVSHYYSANKCYLTKKQNSFGLKGVIFFFFFSFHFSILSQVCFRKFTSVCFMHTEVKKHHCYRRLFLSAYKHSSMLAYVFIGAYIRKEERLQAKKNKFKKYIRHVQERSQRAEKKKLKSVWALINSNGMNKMQYAGQMKALMLKCMTLIKCT